MANPRPPIKYDKSGKRKTVNPHTATKYDGGMPNRYLDLCAKGGTSVEFCAQERIDRRTFEDYCAKYPDMARAKAMGKTLAEGWWIKQARDHLITETIKTTDEDGNSISSSKKFDANLYKFYVGGRFGHSGDKTMRDLARKVIATLEAQGHNIQGAKAPEPEYEEVTEEITDEAR